MSLTEAEAAQVILTGKANEHGSAGKGGNVPPAILHFTAADLAAEIAFLKQFTTSVRGLVVANSFNGVSYRPSAGVMDSAAPAYVVSQKNDDWPEANNNRHAQVLLTDDSGQVTARFQIPFLDDAKNDTHVRSVLGTLLANYNIVQSGYPGAPRLTRIARVQIVTR